MRWLLTFFFILLTRSALFAQPQPVPPGEYSIVKDSAGRQYSYPEWQPLVKKDFKLSRITSKDTEGSEYLLVRLSEQEMAENLKQENERMEKMPRPRESNSFNTGERMSLFNTSDIDGNRLNLKEMKGKILVINFWFINCPPCKKEIPELNELVDSFAHTGKVNFIGIALDNKSSLKEFLEKIPFHYTIVDNGRFLAGRYGIRYYPTHVIVDTEGRIYFHTSGLASNTVYWLKKSITELLAKPVTASTN